MSQFFPDPAPAQGARFHVLPRLRRIGGCVMASADRSLELGARRDTASARSERLNTIGWGLVFLLVGSLALPGGLVAEAAVAAVGALMLVFNVALIAGGHRLDLFTTVLGATAVLVGIGAMVGARIDAFAVFFLVLGAVMVVVPLLRMARAGR
jgi:hypothetical protein